MRCIVNGKIVSDLEIKQDGQCTNEIATGQLMEGKAVEEEHVAY